MKPRPLVEYPAVFEDDSDGYPVIGQLRLPKDITQAEADRVKAMIDSLVVPSGRNQDQRVDG